MLSVGRQKDDSVQSGESKRKTVSECAISRKKEGGQCAISGKAEGRQ